MIIDILPNQYESLAKKNGFCPWQTGLLASMIAKEHQGDSSVINIHMGRNAGHTYFARAVASSDFPSRTKVFVTRQGRINEFAALLFDRDKVHEPIGVLTNYHDLRGLPHLDFIIIDMSDEHPRRFQDEINDIYQTSKAMQAQMLLMQPNFSDFSVT